MSLGHLRHRVDHVVCYLKCKGRLLQVVDVHHRAHLVLNFSHYLDELHGVSTAESGETLESVETNLSLVLFEEGEEHGHKALKVD